MQLNADFRFPEIFAQIGRKLPLPLTHTTFLLALELARKQGLLEAPEEIQDKSFLLCISMILASIFSFDVKRASSSVANKIQQTSISMPMR